MMQAIQNHVSELTFASGHAYADPFNEVTLDAVFTDPQGREMRVPAFWDGEQRWCVRYAPAQPGRHLYRTICLDEVNADLHGRQGSLEVAPYSGANPLLRHGRLRVAADQRHLEHADGKPFFWLGDTWWMALCRRLTWPEGFRELVADRVAKGFSLIQIVAGLYPDMELFDERGANEAGFPWERDFSRINPAYFQMADLRLAHLVQSGLVPCIVGSWGYFMGFVGPEVLKRHWGYLIARYGAYPVVWCAAGEALMDYYVGQAPGDPEERRRGLRAAWSDLLRFIRSRDAFGNPVTIHPTRYGHDQVDDPSLLDVDMLQTGHGGYVSLAPAVDIVTESLALAPRRPVLVGEGNYEGILESSREEMQRFLFWSCLLSGAAGHTYGANGLWQVNGRERPYGRSPHGTSWGDTPWEDAYRLPGSGQLGLGKRLLERHRWWLFEPHPEWVRPHQTPGNRLSAYAAGIPGEVRFLYLTANLSFSALRGGVVLAGLEPGIAYRGTYVNPKDGSEEAFGPVKGDANGECVLPKAPIFQDWVVVLERSG